MEKKNKSVIVPSYLKSFSCIGGNCEDTCCAGWMITIDEPTYKKYKKVKDKTMKARLDKELVAKKGASSEEYVAKIKLKNGRCAFLTGKGWCDIYTHLGENHLSHSCTLYPRTINRVNEGLEYSLAFSCPEAVRHILFQSEGIRFEGANQPTSTVVISAELKLSANKDHWKGYLLELREWILALLQDRKYTFEDRFYLLEEEMKQLNQFIRTKQAKKIPQYLTELRTNRASSLETTINVGQMSKESITLAKCLQKLSEEKKLSSKRYLECLEKTLTGLGFDPQGQVRVEEAERKFQEGYTQYYKPLLEERAYILENYFVNYIFERCIPLDGEMPLESFERMKLYGQLIRLHIVGMALIEGAVKDESIVKFIQSFSKVFDHSDEYIKRLLEFTKNA